MSEGLVPDGEDVEVPAADAREQQAAVDDPVTDPAGELPLEADQADVLEQDSPLAGPDYDERRGGG